MGGLANIIRISDLKEKLFAQKALQKGIRELQKGRDVFELSESDRLARINEQGLLDIKSFELAGTPDQAAREYVPDLARYYRTPLGDFKVLIPTSENRLYVVHELPHYTLIEWGERESSTKELDRVLKVVDLAVFLPFGNVGTLIDSSTFEQVHMGKPQVVIGTYREKRYEVT